MENRETERRQVLKKAKNMMKKIDNEEEATKIIKIIMASYELDPVDFVSILR